MHREKKHQHAGEKPIMSVDAEGSEKATAYFSGIDFGATGKQLGFGHVSHSDDVYDASIIPMPVAVISSGPGPVALIVAGTHGDEYEGQIVAHELIRELEPSAVHGTIMVVPAANSPAVRSATRVSPIDGGNLNRSYPGDLHGEPTSQVAALITKFLLPRADFLIDLHSGGSNTTYLPSSFVYRGPNEDLWKRKVRAVRKLGLEYAMVVAPFLEPGSLSSAGDRAGIPTISTELCGGGTIDRSALETMRHGIRALLADLDILEMPAELMGQRVEPKWIELSDQSAVISTRSGLFEPLVNLGDKVRAGQPVARVHFIDELDRAPATFSAEISGVVAILRRPTRVVPGAHLVNIAREMTPDEVQA